MTSARGRANRGNSSMPVVLPKSTRFTQKGGMILESWERLSDQEKHAWGYDFSNYKKAKESI